MSNQKILVAICGASGSIYAERLIEELCARLPRVYVVISETGKAVIRHELGKRESDSECSLRSLAEGKVPAAFRDKIRVFQESDLFAPVASGSSVPDQMVVVPCSMGAVARIAHGLSTNLIERAADVVLKQHRPLTICPRETPLNTIHLKNLLSLAEMGVKIVPAMPAFYQKPKTIEDLIDFYVGRILEVLGLDHNLYTKWNSRML